MPCHDVTEQLSITLDSEDRIIHYRLTKLTCGGSVGNPSLLRKWVADRSANDVLAARPEAVLEAIPTTSETWNYLTRKHLYALQQGLAALLGHTPARPVDACVITSVETTERGIRMEADLRVDLKTDDITACGGCGSCSPKPPTTA
jgi:hypothetical protein